MMLEILPAEMFSKIFSNIRIFLKLFRDFYTDLSPRWQLLRLNKPS